MVGRSRVARSIDDDFASNVMSLTYDNNGNLFEWPRNRRLSLLIPPAARRSKRFAASGRSNVTTASCKNHVALGRLLFRPEQRALIPIYTAVAAGVGAPQPDLSGGNVTA